MFDAALSRVIPVFTKVNPNVTAQYKNPKDIRYVTTNLRRAGSGQQFLVGGVSLGISIANDIFESKLKPTSTSMQHDGRHKCGDP